MMTRWTLVLMAMAAMAAETPRQGGQLVLAMQAEPKTLDPLLAADEPSELVRYLTSGTLLRLNRVTQKMEPELATAWKVIDQGRGMTIELRSGVTFSDGTAFVAQDVCYTMERALEPGLESIVGEAFRFDKGKATCETGPGMQVTFHFPEVRVGFERLLDGVPILSSRSAAKMQATLGPFTVGEQKAGAYLVLNRNPRYWKKDEAGRRLPYLDSIRLEIQRNRELELARFRTGELAIVNNLDADASEKLKAAQPGLVRDLGVSLDSEQLWFNQVAAAPIPGAKKQWFQSAEFRLAVSQAIHRDDLARVVYKGMATPAMGPVSPANRFWVHSGLRAQPADARAALNRLTKAGFKLQNEVLRDSTGTAVEFSIITNSGNKARLKMATMIQQDLAALGIRVSVVPLDFPSLIERITASFNYDACLLGLVASDLDPNAQMNVWLSSAAQHQWNPSQRSPATKWEAEIDRQMQAQAATADARKRKAAFDRVQQIAVEQAPFLYLVYRNAAVAVQPAVRNVEASILRPQTLWNAERIYLSTAAAGAAR